MLAVALLASLAAVLSLVYFRLFRVPSGLRHLPRVSVSSLFWSYISGEPDDRRFERLVLPYADRGDRVVLVWALGRWMVHVIEYDTAKEVSEDAELFAKELPPDDLVLWRYVGRSNILLTNGETWKRHSRAVRGPINQTVPIPVFVSLTKKLCTLIDAHGGAHVQWDDLAQRITLDAVGESVLGYNFKALEAPSPFLAEYNSIFADIANPLYLLWPGLDQLFPRKRLIERIDSSLGRFQSILDAKREKMGQKDMMSLMLRDPEMTNDELRDNMVILFISGYDSTSGSLTTLIYYLAKHPDLQERARREVLAALGHSDPTEDVFRAMPFLQACIKEGLRINQPVLYPMPRCTTAPALVGGHAVPAGSSLIVNNYVIHHRHGEWKDPYRYDPGRFLDGAGKLVAEERAWVPFGMGVRQCPARKFSLMEQYTIVAMLLREYEWSLPAHNIHLRRPVNAPSPFALSCPHNMPVVFTRLA